MRAGAPFANEFVTELRWEWKIGQVVTVNVPELDLAEPELDALEAMSFGRHPLPAEDRSLDRAARSIHAGQNLQKRPAIPSTPA